MANEPHIKAINLQTDRSPVIKGINLQTDKTPVLKAINVQTDLVGGWVIQSATSVKSATVMQ